MNTRFFGHGGDIGDCIAALPSIRAMGGGHIRIGSRPDGSRETMKGKRYEALRPLLAAQPYVASVAWTDDWSEITHDFSTFRGSGLRQGESLAHWQARHIGTDISTEPWLSVRPSKVAYGRTVIARSPRYHNTARCWQKVVSRFKDALFVGLPEEHKALQGFTGSKIDYAPTNDLLEMAQIIAGASLFIGNQSSPWWIACGLGVPTIQESWPYGLNSMIDRPNCRYWINPPFDL